jgi:hypothetical protein
MIVLGRHRALAQDAWSELAVRAAIEEIATDAVANFDPDTFWPGHPSDDGVGDGNTSFYMGAAGVIWALYYLHRIGAVSAAEDFRPVLPKLLERTSAAFESNSPTGYSKHGSRYWTMAVMANSQVAVGRGRYSLWTGDVGLAIYLWDCITGEARFPTVDVF